MDSIRTLFPKRMLLRLAVGLVVGLDYLLLGSLGACIRAHRRLSCGLARCCENGAPEGDERLQLSIDVIQRHFDEDKHRLERIEDKARNNVFAVGAGLALLTPAIAFCRDEKIITQMARAPRIGCIVLLGVGISYFLVSAIMSLRSYRVGQVYRPDLKGQPPLLADEPAKRELLNCLELNRLIIIERANCLSVAMSLLRNAIVCVGLFLLVTLFWG